LVFGIGHLIENCDRAPIRKALLREEAAGDADFVPVGLRREGEEAGMLGLPAEPADAGSTGRLEDGNIGEITLHPGWLAVPIVPDVRVRNRLDVAISQRAQGDPQAPDVLTLEGPLLNRGIDGPVLDQRAVISLFRKDPATEAGRAQLRDLASPTRYRILVAIDTRLSVVHRAEATFNLVA
jgi:hypothetical protein